MRHMTDTDRARLLAHAIANAEARRHKRCPTHGPSAVVCQGCARVFCPACEQERCPRCKAPRDVRVVHAPTPQRKRGRPKGSTNAPRPVLIQASYPRDWPRGLIQALRRYTPLAISPHAESGGWQIEVPYRLDGYATASDLADELLPAIKEWAAPTPFGAGRLFRPDRWFVSFQLRAGVPAPRPAESRP